MKKIVISFIIGIIIGGASIGILAYKYYTNKPDKIVIKEVEKPVVKYIKQISYNDNAGLYACYSSPIVIDRKLTGNIYRIRASDGCKQTEVSDKIEVGSSGNYKFYISAGIIGLVAGSYCTYKLIK